MKHVISCNECYSTDLIEYDPEEKLYECECCGHIFELKNANIEVESY